MRTLFNLFLALTLCGIGPIAHAQSLRPPTPAERAALQKVMQALHPITNSFNDSNWDTEDNNFDPSLVVPDGARSQCKIGYTIRLGLRQGSPAYHQVMDPLLAYTSSGGNLDGKKVELLSKNVEKLSAVTIDINVNDGAIPFGDDAKDNKQLNVPGAAKAFIEAVDDNDPSEDAAYVLAFGNWNDARYDGENHVLRFRFKHPPQTPYIENVTLLMRGNSQKIEEMIRGANWNSIYAALAK